MIRTVSALRTDVVHEVHWCRVGIWKTLRCGSGSATVGVIATSAFDNRCHVAPTVQAQAVDSEVLLYRRNQSYHRIRPTSYCLLGHE